MFTLKDGRNRAVIYWQLNYRRKFFRTLWMIPFSIAVIILLFAYSELSGAFKVIATSVLIVTLLSQLFYTHFKWKHEEQNVLDNQ